MFTLDERMRVKVGTFKAGNKHLCGVVNACRTELATNFNRPSMFILADHARKIGLDGREMQRFLGDLVEEGL